MSYSLSLCEPSVPVTCANLVYLTALPRFKTAWCAVAAYTLQLLQFVPEESINEISIRALVPIIPSWMLDTHRPKIMIPRDDDTMLCTKLESC
jgi:hypothetical protein